GPQWAWFAGGEPAGLLWMSWGPARHEDSTCLEGWQPGDHYRGPALALGAGGYGMSVLIFSCSRPCWLRGTTPPAPRREGRSAADAEPLPDCAVAVDVLLGQVLQQPAAAADQQQ